MDLLSLGSKARKTGIEPPRNAAKDEHDMESINEYFKSDDEEEISGVGAGEGRMRAAGRRQPESLRGRTGKRVISGGNTELRNVARKINFSEAEAESFKLSPIALGSKQQQKKDKHKKSPLRSPLQENQVSRQQEQIDEGFGQLDDFNNDDYDDFNEVHDDSLSPIPLESIQEDLPPLSPPSDKAEQKSANSLTKRMALGKTANRKTQKTKQPGNLISPPQDQSSLIKKSRRPSIKPKETITKPSPLPSPPPDGLRRSKRTRIAPLAYWRNERIVYSRADEKNNDPDSTLIKDIRKVPLQEIESVVHIPDSNTQSNIPNKKRSRQRSRSTPPKLKRSSSNKSNDEYDYESDPEIDGSQWFKNKIKKINIRSQPRKIAFTPDAGDFESPPNRDGEVVQDNYKVATLFDSYRESIAGGLLEFPIEGFKGLRNSSSSTLLCHVVKGLIEVSINEEVFLVTRGCSFEIPSDINYSLKNRGRIPAKIFFIQTNLNDELFYDEL